MPSDGDLRSVRGFLAREGIDLRGQTVLAAFSGGADSVAMLLLLQAMAADDGFALAVCHVDHGIRGDEAKRDALFCADFCTRHGLRFVLKCGDAPAIQQKQHLGMEDAARRLRYELLSEAAEELQADWIVTAHTADDQLETVLLQLTRGTGLVGLGGIRAQNGRILRPILMLTRADTERIVAECGETYVTDSTNGSDLYARNRLRHAVVPVLKSLNPAVAHTVGENSRVIAAENAYLERLAETALSTVVKEGSMQVKPLLAQDPVMQARLLRRWVADAGITLSQERTAALLALARSKAASGICELSGAMVCCKRYDALVVTVREKNEAFSLRLTDLVNQKTAVLNAYFTAEAYEVLPNRENTERIYKLFNHCQVNCATIKGEAVIRNRRSGDLFQKNAHSGTKTLKQLMIDRKIPRDLRDRLPVVADDDGVIWVWGLGYNAARADCANGNAWYRICFTENKSNGIQP